MIAVVAVEGLILTVKRGIQLGQNNTNICSEVQQPVSLIELGI